MLTVFSRCSSLRRAAAAISNCGVRSSIRSGTSFCPDALTNGLENSDRAGDVLLFNLNKIPGLHQTGGLYFLSTHVNTLQAAGVE